MIGRTLSQFAFLSCSRSSAARTAAHSCFWRSNRAFRRFPPPTTPQFPPRWRR